MGDGDGQSWLQRNLIWVILGALMLVGLPVLCCAGGIAYLGFQVTKTVSTSLVPAGPPTTQVYYYDLVTGKLFAGPVDGIPPLATPDGSTMRDGQPAGVRANVFSCGACNDKEWYIGYLETYNPEAQKAQIKMNQEFQFMAQQAQSGGSLPPTAGPTAQEMMLISEGHLVADPAKMDAWVKQESPEGAALVNAAIKKCPGGKYPIQCLPVP